MLNEEQLTKLLELQKNLDDIVTKMAMILHEGGIKETELEKAIDKTTKTGHPRDFHRMIKLYVDRKN